MSDTTRIHAIGMPAVQVDTGRGCHLNAQMITDVAPRLPPDDNGILFIESIDNFVRPANFDLSEKHKMAVLSVTESKDKPLKHPHMFAAASPILPNKADLLPYLNFDAEEYIACARGVNSEVEIIPISATSGEGMNRWLNWLEIQRRAQTSPARSALLTATRRKPTSATFNAMSIQRQSAVTMKTISHARAGGYWFTLVLP